MPASHDPGSHNPEQPQPSGRDRRRDSRVPFRTLAMGVALEGDHGEFTLFKAWSDDISGSGAGLICDRQISVDQIYLRLLLPGFERRLIECRIVARRLQTRLNLADRQKQRYAYGVRFLRVVDISEVTGLLLSSLSLLWPESGPIAGTEAACTETVRT